MNQIYLIDNLLLGLLRDNWIHKHRELLPSTVILVTTFSVDWSSSEWMRREASFFDRYTRLKNSVAGRDVKIVLLPVRVGAAQSSIDKVSISFIVYVIMPSINDSNMQKYVTNFLNDNYCRMY